MWPNISYPFISSPRFTVTLTNVIFIKELIIFCDEMIMDGISTLFGSSKSSISIFRIRILDCYSDPLGWKDKLLGLGIHVNFSKTEAIPFKDVGNMEKLFTSIVDIGRGIFSILIMDLILII